MLRTFRKPSLLHSSFRESFVSLKLLNSYSRQTKGYKLFDWLYFQIQRILMQKCSTGGRYDGPIVLSGISGRFPKASNVKELIEKLFAGEDLTSETSLRWKNNMIPKRFGFLDCWHKFDASFFGMTPQQTVRTDPQARLLLEVAFEAIVDAGMSFYARIKYALKKF